MRLAVRQRSFADFCDSDPCNSLNRPAFSSAWVMRCLPLASRARKFARVSLGAFGGRFCMAERLPEPPDARSANCSLAPNSGSDLRSLIFGFVGKRYGGFAVGGRRRGLSA